MSVNAILQGQSYTRIQEDALLSTKQDNLTFDTTPIASSSNPVTSGGVASALNTKMTKGVDYVTAGQLAGATLGIKATAEGSGTIASGENSHSEGVSSRAYGNNSHAEGQNTVAFGENSHAENYFTVAIGDRAHAEGRNGSVTSNSYSITFTLPTPTLTTNYRCEFPTSSINDIQAYLKTGGVLINNNNEGRFITGVSTVTAASTVTSSIDITLNEAFSNTISAVTLRSGGANGDTSHTEGAYTAANGSYSHAEGYFTNALGAYSHAEGSRTSAQGANSHAEGVYTTALGNNQHVFGINNTPSLSYVEIVGNGTSVTQSNARTLDWNGNEWLAGNLDANKVTVRATPTVNTDVSTKKYVDDKFSEIPDATSASTFPPKMNGATATGTITTSFARPDHVHPSDTSKSDIDHQHNATDISSGVLQVARGGTGNTTLQATRNAMGLGNTTGALPVANGGTGATTTANARSNLNAAIMNRSNYLGSAGYPYSSSGSTLGDWETNNISRSNAWSYIRLNLTSLSSDGYMRYQTGLDPTNSSYYGRSYTFSIRYGISTSNSSTSVDSTASMTFTINSSGQIVFNGTTYSAGNIVWSTINSTYGLKLGVHGSTGSTQRIYVYVGLASKTTQYYLCIKGAKLELGTESSVVDNAGRLYNSLNDTNDTLSVSKGGTGIHYHYKNGIILGGTEPINSTQTQYSASQLHSIRSTAGALYATASDSMPAFGTLPVAYGGTGASTFSSGALLIGNGTSAVGTRAITNNTNDTAASENTNIPTMNTLFHTLAKINGNNQTHATTIYAPTSAGTSGYILKSSGAGAPTWLQKLPITNGGTGATTTADALSNLGAAAASHSHAAGDITSGTLPVNRGGTGASYHFLNGVILGGNTKTTDSDNYSATAFKSAQAQNGALYATGTNATPTFGILPVAQGGTGKTTAAEARANLGAAAASHTHAATDISSGVLSAARGGTGLGLTSINQNFLYSEAHNNFDVGSQWDDYSTTGVYAFNSASTWTNNAHAPWTSSHVGVLLVLAYSNNYAVQIAFSCSNSDVPKYRRKQNGSWQSWGDLINTYVIEAASAQ